MSKEFPAKFSAVDKSRTFDKYININTTCLLIHLMISYHTYYVVLNKTCKYSAWEYEVVRSPTNSQETAVLESLLDLSQPWESLVRIYEEGLDAGWLTSIAYGGEVLVTPKDRLEN